MNPPMLFSGLGCGAAAGLLLRMAKQELTLKRSAGNLKLTPIAKLQPGLCLTAGEVVCETPLKTPYSRTPAVSYRYDATQKGLHDEERHRKKPDQMLSSGIRSCSFLLKDDTGVIEVRPDGGKTLSYPHQRIMASRSGKRTPVGCRIEKLKAIDRENHPEGEKKPFFRKIEMADAPLDVPEDLFELAPGSPEAKKAFRKYTERWVQAGDHVCVLGTVAVDKGGPSRRLSKAGKNSPLLVATEANELTAGAFGRNFKVASLAGLGFGMVGIFLFLGGLGIIGR